MFSITIMGSAVRFIFTLVRAVTRSNVGRRLFVAVENDIRFQTSGEKTFKTTTMANNSAENKFHKYLIVGMCNHGMPKSRHSVGIQVLDRLAADLDLKWTRDKNCAGFTATFDLNEGAQVIMLKPKQFMNVNGKSVGKTVRQHNIDADKVYLMHDDLDRALGKVSIKEGGSAGGHNGIKSVQSLLGSAVNKMFKVRIGIDRPSSKDEVVEYVLTNFTQEEMTGVQEGVAKALQLWTWHLEGRGENVLLLTNLYGINPKITQSLNRKKKKEKIKSKDTVLSDKTDIGISTTSRTHLEKGVVSTDKHLDTTSISGRQRVESVSSADKQQDRISRTHSEDGEVTVDMEVKRTKGE